MKPQDILESYQKLCTALSIYFKIGWDSIIEINEYNGMYAVSFLNSGIKLISIEEFNQLTV